MNWKQRIFVTVVLVFIVTPLEALYLQYGTNYGFFWVYLASWGVIGFAILLTKIIIWSVRYYEKLGES